MSSAARLALVLALAVGCRGKATPAAPPQVADAAVTVPATVDAGAAVVDAGAPPADAAEAASVRIPDEARQLIVVEAAGWNSTRATIARWQREPGQPWQAVSGPDPAILGYAGVAWGRGLHGDGAPDGRSGPMKREGDGRSPAGIFALGPAYGYAAAAPPGTRVRYTPSSDTLRCVDDGASKHYNQIVDEAAVASDWSSAEDLRRGDAQYTWVVDVRHNAAAVPEGGSCIFLHVWSGPKGKTTGCTAMAEPVMNALLAGLDPAARPVLVLLPASERAALAEAWGIP